MKLFLILLVVVLLVGGGVGLIVALASLQSDGARPAEFVPPTASPEPNHPQTIAPTDQQMSDSILLLVPVIEYEDDNRLSDPVIVEYRPTRVAKQEAFVIEPATLGYEYEQAVGALKLKLVDVLSDSIEVEVMGDRRFDGNFHPRDAGESVHLRIGSDSCLDAFPLVMDVFYRYCFELNRTATDVQLTYTLVAEGAMPQP